MFSKSVSLPCFLPVVFLICKLVYRRMRKAWSHVEVRIFEQNTLIRNTKVTQSAAILENPKHELMLVLSWILWCLPHCLVECKFIADIQMFSVHWYLTRSVLLSHSSSYDQNLGNHFIKILQPWNCFVCFFLSSFLSSPWCNQCVRWLFFSSL